MSLRLCLIVSLLWIPITSASQFHIQLENDAAFGEDGNYSSGLIFGWESKASPAIQTNRGLHNWQQTLFLFQRDAYQAWGLKVTQRMWTPNEIKIVEAQPYERPYAGVLEFEQHTALYSSDVAQKSWLAIGVIGPASGTEKLQDLIHKLIGSSAPQGWQYQVKNKATIQLSYEIDYLLLRESASFNRQWEISAFNHNALGNTRSDIDVGLTFRWGTNLERSFGQSSSHFGHVGNHVSTGTPQSLLFFTRLQAGYRFNDITIDGKLPYQSKIEFNPQKTSATTGLSYYYSGGAVTWSFNIYSKEYLTDEKSWHGYGLLQFSWSI